VKIVYDDGRYRQEYDMPDEQAERILRNAASMRRQALEEFGRTLPPSAWSAQ
jgi:hypothetical protein